MNSGNLCISGIDGPQKIDLFNMSPRDVSMRNIVWGLKRVNRYNGQTIPRYSVARHSVFVCRQAVKIQGRPLTPREKLNLLLHDAHEYYIGDIISPTVEYAGVTASVDRAKRRLDRIIFEGLGVAPPNSQERELVAKADAAALIEEMEIFFGPRPRLWRKIHLFATTNGFESALRNALFMGCM